MMNNITLSYVLTTFNKLPYLKVVLQNLIENCLQDEEIVITDGGSTDGTVAYLQELYEQGKIHQFVSEKDYGEAHGFNKGMLMAKGEIIKLLSDDDVFNWQGIQECKKYMLQNTSVDITIGNICSVGMFGDGGTITIAKNYQVWFENYVLGKTKNCFFCCLSLLIRKEKLSFLGLFDVSFKHTDFEYSVRVTSIKANIAFYKPLLVCAVMNPNSISYNFRRGVEKEIKRVSDYYDYEYPLGIVKKERTKDLSTSLIKKLFSILSYKQCSTSTYYPDYNYVLLEYGGYTSFYTLYPYLSSHIDNFNREHTYMNNDLFIENIL